MRLKKGEKTREGQKGKGRGIFYYNVQNLANITTGGKNIFHGQSPVKQKQRERLKNESLPNSNGRW